MVTLSVQALQYANLSSSLVEHLGTSGSCPRRWSTRGSTAWACAQRSARLSQPIIQSMDADVPPRGTLTCLHVALSLASTWHSHVPPRGTFACLHVALSRTSAWHSHMPPRGIIGGWPAICVRRHQQGLLYPVHEQTHHVLH